MESIKSIIQNIIFKNLKDNKMTIHFKLKKSSLIFAFVLLINFVFAQNNSGQKESNNATPNNLKGIFDYKNQMYDYKYHQDTYENQLKDNDHSKLYKNTEDVSTYSNNKRKYKPIYEFDFSDTEKIESIKKTLTKENLRTAKKFASLAFEKYIHRNENRTIREPVIDISNWIFDEYTECYYIEFTVFFEEIKENYYTNWLNQSEFFKLKCDFDGHNVILNIENKTNFFFQTLYTKKALSEDSE